MKYMKNIKVFIGLLSIIVAIILIQNTYAYYFTDKEIDISSNGSSIYCSYDLDTPISNSKFGYSQFSVTVNNYSGDDITSEPFNYVLTIENDSGNNGLFGYENTFSDTLVFRGSMANTEKIDNEYIIQVRTVSGLREGVDYKIKLDCVQDN